MEKIITIDDAGRLVIPKGLRRRYRLHGGAKLRIMDRGDVLLIEPIAEQAELVEKEGLLLVGSKLKADAPDHRRLRERRLKELEGMEP